MYGYYDRSDRRTKWVQTAAAGVGAAALGAALANRERIGSWVARTADSLVANETVRGAASATTKFAFDAADSFQNILRQNLENDKRFRSHFSRQDIVDRGDFREMREAVDNLGRQEFEYRAAGEFKNLLSRTDSRVNGQIWTGEKIDAFLEQTGIFTSLLNQRGTSFAEVPNLIREKGGRFRDILHRDAAANGRTFDQELQQTLRDLEAVRLHPNLERPAKDEMHSFVRPVVENEYARRLSEEVARGSTLMERLTGARRARVTEEESGRLQNFTTNTINTSQLAGARENARYEIGAKAYDFSAYRSMFLSAKDFLADRFSVPLSLFQQGISAGQLFPFIGRSGDKPLVGVYDRGFRPGEDFQVFMGDRLISMNEGSAVSTSEETFQFTRANKAHIRRMVESQREAAAEGQLTGNVFSRAFQTFRGGLGQVEAGTSPYWDKVQGFFRKFNAPDYQPNLLRRAGQGALTSESDALALSKVLRASSLKVTTDDLVSVVRDMENQTLTLNEAWGGNPLIRDMEDDEREEARRLSAQGDPWPRRVDPSIHDWIHDIQQGEGSEYAKYARAYDSMNDFLGNTRLPSPKLRRFRDDMAGRNLGDRERYLARTASYEDSRRAETLFGLDLTTGATRVTNLDILRGEMLVGLQQVSRDSESNTFDEISRRALLRGQTHASFLAQSLVVDEHIAGNQSNIVQNVNDYLSHPDQGALRSYLERESRDRFSFLHVHPKQPADTRDFSSRHRVIAVRTSKRANDGIAGLSRAWRAYTSPSSIADQDVSQGSMFSYFLMDRLHSAFHEIGIGLPASMRSSPARMALGMIALRYVPVFLGIPEAHKFINRVTRDTPLLRLLNPDINRANALDYLSRTTHRGGLRRKALALIPGLDFYTDDRSQSDEDRAQRGAAYTPVRKGRWWAFGSREAFFGEKISYYAPSAARIARSDYQAADNVNRNNWLYWKHFGGFLNPLNWGKGAYWQEEAGQKDRPYLFSGPAFDPGHPWSAPLNALFGWFLKPRRIYHPEYLPEHLGGTLEQQDAIRRPTSPFYRRSALSQQETAAGGVRPNRGGVGGRGAGADALPVSGAEARGPGAGRPADGRGREAKKLPPGYVDRIPRARRMRDPQYDPLLDRINLARDLRGENRLDQANQSGLAPEEAAYIRSIGLSGGWDNSLYHLQEIAGLYGWFGSLARPQIGHPVGKVEVADPSRGYGRERRFYDQEIGGIGGNISDILRRFLPHRRRSVTQYDPVPNNMPSWMPGSDNLVDFTRGDPFIKVPLGEMRLPGSAYERLHPGTTARMFRLRASSIGKSQEEMEAYLVKKEGDGRTSAAAEMGTKMHRVLQERWRRLGIMEADEVEVFDPKLNVTGHIDAILRIPDRQGREQRVIADIKTKTAAKYAEVVRTNRPEDENLDQILFYMQATGIKRGLLTYVNREDVRQVHQIEVKFDKARFRQAVSRMEAARSAVRERIKSGEVKAGDLYDPLTKYEILADVAPFSRQFAEMQQWAERSKEAMSSEDQRRLEDAQSRLKRQRGGFELHAYRFRPERTQTDRVQIDKFLDRQTFLTTSGQTYKIAGINAARANRLDTVSNDEWWQRNTGLKSGSHVTVTTLAMANVQKTQAATVFAAGRNVGARLLKKGLVEEDREDYSEPGRRTRFTPGEQLFGRVSEWLLHQNNPIATKFFPVRSGLEQYERTDVYGKKSASWESPVSSYVWPTLASFTNKNPVAAAGMGALLGATFFAFSEQRIPALKYGALIGIGLSIFGMVMRSNGTPFIPWAVQRRRKLDAYYDNLTYVKYRRLAAQEETLAHHKENINVNDLEGDNLQNVDKENKEHVEGLIATRRALEMRRSRLQERLKHAREGNPIRAKHIRNEITGLDETISATQERTRRETREGRYPVGPHALQALLYRQRYRSTMRGALEGGSWEAALAALPKPTRTAIVDVIHNGSRSDKNKLFSILPKDQQAVLGYALGIDERRIPTMETLQHFFHAHPLPTADWSGWRADASLDLLKARDIVTGHKHLDPMDFGIFPTTVEAAQYGSPEAEIPLPKQARRYRGTNQLQQSLHDLMVGHGLMGVHVEVTETEGGDDGHEANVDMQVSQRREHAFFHGFKRHAQKGAFTPQ